MIYDDQLSFLNNRADSLAISFTIITHHIPIKRTFSFAFFYWECTDDELFAGIIALVNQVIRVVSVPVYLCLYCMFWYIFPVACLQLTFRTLDNVKVPDNLSHFSRHDLAYFEARSSILFIQSFNIACDSPVGIQIKIQIGQISELDSNLNAYHAYVHLAHIRTS